jgi:hypothetical protein
MLEIIILLPIFKVSSVKHTASIFRVTSELCGTPTQDYSPQEFAVLRPWLPLKANTVNKGNCNSSDKPAVDKESNLLSPVTSCSLLLDLTTVEFENLSCNSENARTA